MKLKNLLTAILLLLLPHVSAYALDIPPDRGLVLQEGQTLKLDRNSSNVKDIASRFSAHRRYQIENTRGRIITSGEIPTAELTEGHVYIVLKSLEMRKGSRLVIGSDVKSIVFEVSESVFGEGSIIEAIGANSSGPEVPGGNAAEITLKLGETNLNGLKIISIGGNGATGRTGSKGSNAERKRCRGHSGKPAGQGGPGGNGSNGGNAGAVIIYADVNSSAFIYSLESFGGKGGSAGAGGPGGDGTGSVSCPLYKRGGHSRGNPGPSGRKGNDGKTSTVQLILTKP